MTAPVVRKAKTGPVNVRCLAMLQHSPLCLARYGYGHSMAVIIKAYSRVYLEEMALCLAGATLEDVYPEWKGGEIWRSVVKLSYFAVGVAGRLDYARDCRR